MRSACVIIRLGGADHRYLGHADQLVGLTTAGCRHFSHVGDEGGWAVVLKERQANTVDDGYRNDFSIAGHCPGGSEAAEHERPVDSHGSFPHPRPIGRRPLWPNPNRSGEVAGGVGGQFAVTSGSGGGD